MSSVTLILRSVWTATPMRKHFLVSLSIWCLVWWPQELGLFGCWSPTRSWFVCAFCLFVFLSLSLICGGTISVWNKTYIGTNTDKRPIHNGRGLYLFCESIPALMKRLTFSTPWHTDCICPDALEGRCSSE